MAPLIAPSVRVVGFQDEEGNDIVTNGLQLAAPTAASRIPSAAATTNATVAKASAGRLYGVNGHNAAAAVRYIKFYDKATAPTVGTDVPVLTLACAASVPFAFSFPTGFVFATGIAYAMVTGAADNSTAALTLADVLGLNVTYA